MNASSQSNTHDFVIDRPPPLIPDLCSVQAAGADPANPIVTIYRKRAATAAEWIARAAGAKRFETYLLQHGSGRWELHNACGQPTDRGNTLPPTKDKESTTPVIVDREEFSDEARAFIGDPGLTLLACAEGHAGASAADHANFNVICRRMIGEASPADLEQIYLFDSRKWPCRVTGAFGNVAKMSPEMQDIYLDRVKWIRNSWPLIWEEFSEILADRLATVRSSYTYELLLDCARAARMPEKRLIGLRGYWMMSSPTPKYRFARHIVETLREGLLQHPGTAETFSPEIVQRCGAAVVKDYKKHLMLSRS